MPSNPSDNGEQRQQDLADIRIIAEKLFGFLRIVLAPLLVIGITALVGGCFQVRDMSRDSGKCRRFKPTSIANLRQ